MTGGCSATRRTGGGEINVAGFGRALEETRPHVREREAALVVVLAEAVAPQVLALLPGALVAVDGDADELAEVDDGHLALVARNVALGHWGGHCNKQRTNTLNCQLIHTSMPPALRSIRVHLE